MRRIVLVLFLLWVAGYAGFRQTHLEAWAKDNLAYVIFPAVGAGLALYYGWRPLTYLDTAATGMHFHIGPHR